MNMRDPESIKTGIDKTAEHFGGLDIVINNAAILVPVSYTHLTLPTSDLV